MSGHDSHEAGGSGAGERDPSKPVLVTGATGYLGGRLAPRLLEAGYSIRCLARSARKLEDRSWIGDRRVEVIEDDLSDVKRTAELVRGCGASYYLIHSMASAGDGFSDRDRALARAFARAAELGGLERIIYMGGLGEMGPNLSRHLRSRQEVEADLASGAVPVTTLRAAMIIGSGSASFEILRYLVERLPIMVTPRWVQTESQPIAAEDVLGYLVDCLRTPETIGKTLDVGGPEVLTYQRLMRVMAEVRGLPPRLIIPVPVLTPRLSSLWIGLVTPVTPRIARPLAEGLRNRVVCRDDEARRLMPGRLLTVCEAIGQSLEHVTSGTVETSWAAAGSIPGDPEWAGGTTFTDERTMEIDASASDVFAALCRIGGGHGWYAADLLWRIRGWMDQLVGGPGLRRGRRHPEQVRYGEALDFWRVVGIEEDRRLELVAEMKLPGEARLSFEIRSRDGAGSNGQRSTLVQTARFRPKGLTGIAYWYAVLPLHGVVFNGMLKGIKRFAESRAGAGGEASRRPART